CVGRGFRNVFYVLDEVIGSIGLRSMTGRAVLDLLFDVAYRIAERIRITRLLGGIGVSVFQPMLLRLLFALILQFFCLLLLLFFQVVLLFRIFAFPLRSNRAFQVVRVGLQTGPRGLHYRCCFVIIAIHLFSGLGFHRSGISLLQLSRRRRLIRKLGVGGLTHGFLLRSRYSMRAP